MLADALRGGRCGLTLAFIVTCFQQGGIDLQGFIATATSSEHVDLRTGARPRLLKTRGRMYPATLNCVHVVAGCFATLNLSTK